MNLLIIVPAYNEAEVIADTIIGIRRALKANKLQTEILVVDDGSSDQTANLSFKHADYLVSHRVNRGLGAALMTGIEFAKRKGYDICVTFDSDGQHDPGDIAKAVRTIEKGYDIVIGSRFLGSHSNMPKMRRIILSLGNFITYLFFGVWTSDSQSGFRALSRKAIQSLVLKSNRMEVSSEFFAEIKRLNLKFAEIPIHINYTAYSLKKGQKNTASMSILIKLLYKVFG